MFCWIQQKHVENKTHQLPLELFLILGNETHEEKMMATH